MKQLNIRNFRDVSGYHNQYGEVMKPKMIFRGAALDQISIEEAKYMEDQLGIHYILDYRDEKEAAGAMDVTFPNALYERISGIQLNDSKGFDFGTMLQGGLSEEKIEILIAYISEGYRKMPFNNPAYHKLFELLLRNDGHVYFHCSAGKDRTGVSAFLIMLALGMNEEDAVEEYLLSNQYIKAYNEQLITQLGIPEMMVKKCESLLYVTKENIQLTISAIKDKYQNYDDFLLNEYGLDQEKRQKLRSIYCRRD